MARTDIQDLLDALKTNSGEKKHLPEENSCLNITESPEEIVKSFECNPIDATIRQAAINIDKINGVLEEARKIIEQTGDTNALDSFANISKAATENLKLISMACSEKAKIDFDKQKLDEQLAFKEKELIQKKELEVMKIEGRSKQVNVPHQTNNFVMLASREELFNLLYEEDKDKRTKVIESISEKNGIIEDIS